MGFARRGVQVEESGMNRFRDAALSLCDLFDFARPSDCRAAERSDEFAPLNCSHLSVHHLSVE
jgi:hypothetical protein